MRGWRERLLRMTVGSDGLGTGERVAVRVRTHGKALIWPVVALIVFTAAFGLGVAAIPADWNPWGTWALVAIYVVLLVWLVVLPFLRWFTSTYTITSRRVITRKGILNKVGHDLPLRRINNVNSERSLSDRIFGCGTLILETAAGQPLVLPDVPRVQEVHLIINELLFDDEEDYHD